MCRDYHLYRVKELSKVKEIEEQVKGLEGLEAVEISEDFGKIRVFAQEESFSQVMDRIVNICKWIVPECDVVYMF